MKNRLYRYSITVALLGLGLANAKAQQTLKVGTNPTTVTNSAVLDVEATNKGVLLPRVALTATNDITTIASPANALTVFNTATAGDVTPGYYYWSGAPQNKWIRLADKEGDLRLIVGNNHITQDAGVGGNGSSVGNGYNNIGIGEKALAANNNGYANMAIGTYALSNNTNGAENIAIGGFALEKNTTGVNNLSIGSYTLQNNVNGYNNLALGTSALSNNDANENMAIGFYALQQNISGYFNVATGNYALTRNTSGEGNLANGYSALYSNTIGNYNLAIGSTALYKSEIGNNNIALGYGALHESKDNDNIGIGNYSGAGLVSGSGNFTVGTSTNVPDNTGSNQMNILNTIYGKNMNGGAGFIGINESVPTNALHVKAAANPLRLEGLQTGANTDQVVVADATGVLKAVNRTNFNGELRNVGMANLITSTAGLFQQGTSLAGMLNIGIGEAALADASYSGVGNTVLGHYAGSVLSSGMYNQVMGYNALNSTTTGSYNIAIGYLSAQSNITGSNNSAVGSNALRLMTLGSNNIAFGFEAGNVHQNGDANTFLGSQSGFNLTGGNRNVFIGALAGYAAPTSISDQLIISNSSNGNDALIKGDFATRNLTINGSNSATVGSPANTSTLNVNGSFSANIITVQNSYTALDNDHTIIFRPTANGNYTFSFPSASANKGRLYHFMAFGGSFSGTLTINAISNAGSSLFIGGLSNPGLTIQSDGTDWIIIKQ